MMFIYVLYQPNVFFWNAVISRTKIYKLLIFVKFPNFFKNWLIAKFWSTGNLLVINPHSKSPRFLCIEISISSLCHSSGKISDFHVLVNKLSMAIWLISVIFNAFHRYSIPAKYFVIFELTDCYFDFFQWKFCYVFLCC